MTAPELIAAVDLASPGLLVAVLVNLAVGLVAGWILARGGFSHWSRHSSGTSSAKVRELANTLSGRVDRHVLRIQELRRDLTRLELASDRQANQILRTLERTIRPLEGELKEAALRLRREAGQRHVPLTKVQRTTTTLADSVHTHHAAVESLKDKLFSQPGDEVKPLVEIVRGLEHLLRTLDRLVASANDEITILVKQGQPGGTLDDNERARPPTKAAAPPSSDDTRDSSSVEDLGGSEDHPSDSDLQKIRALTQQLAEQRASVEREHRSDRRWNLAIPVAAVPLDDSHQPVGEPVSMVTRDISTSGISLLHTQPVPTKFLRVQLDAPILQSTELIVRILRCRTIGAYTEIAGEFVARIDVNERSAVSGQLSVVSGKAES